VLEQKPLLPITGGPTSAATTAESLTDGASRRNREVGYLPSRCFDCNCFIAYQAAAGGASVWDAELSQRGQDKSVVIAPL